MRGSVSLATVNLCFCSDMQAALQEFTLEYALSKIYYYRCHDYIELVALVNLLPEIASQHPKVCVHACTYACVCVRVCVCVCEGRCRWWPLVASLSCLVVDWKLIGE